MIRDLIQQKPGFSYQFVMKEILHLASTAHQAGMFWAPSVAAAKAIIRDLDRWTRRLNDPFTNQNPLKQLDLEIQLFEDPSTSN